MSRIQELPAAIDHVDSRRRTSLITAVCAIVVGVSALVVAPFETPEPAVTPSAGVAASVLACKLHIIRVAPVAAPAEDRFAGVTAASTAAGGWLIRGLVTATNTAGASLTLPWSCATDQHGANWAVSHVAIGNQ